ncbi:hypothetical protein SLS58_009411 [Diplodia intermedia]|uniref:Heterokaryon incompatibility domain-containing protein n=1 Tax=Diplodia intermedia TaxID=856260 RepID=A0ABR3TCQ4_9PEZI
MPVALGLFAHRSLLPSPVIISLLARAKYGMVSEWRALIVNEVDEADLLPLTMARNGKGPDLPTRMVKVPLEDPNQTAVVSWRWDGDLHFRGSRNISGVIFCAKKRGVRYLFIDVISIDQKLPGDALIEQVTAFSTLYKWIPVFAAYDMYDEQLKYTVRRPWILSEIRLFRYNPTKVIYVGHSGGDSTEMGPVDPYGVLPPEVRQYRIGFELEEAWRASFADTIIAVLVGHVGMSSVADFKLIIPTYANILSVAYARMSRNDYLLTVAILCRFHGAPGSIIGEWGEPRNIQYLTYDRYEFDLVDPEPQEYFNSSWLSYSIHLDEVHVASWQHKGNRPEMGDRYLFNPSPDAEVLIFTALGLSESEYRDFVAKEGERHASLTLDHAKWLPAPAVEVVELICSQ